MAFCEVLTAVSWKQLGTVALHIFVSVVFGEDYVMLQVGVSLGWPLQKGYRGSCYIPCISQLSVTLVSISL